MNIKIKAEGFEYIPANMNIPKELKEYYIPGSVSKSSSSDFGSFLVQHIQASEFGFTYCVFKIQQDVCFITSTPNPLVCHICLNGRQEITIGNSTPFYLEENQFSIFYTNSFQKRTYLKKGKTYSSLYISYPLKFLLYTLNFFQGLEAFHNNLLHSKPAFLTGKDLMINIPGADLINKLIHSPFSVSTQDFQVNIIKNLLFILLEQALKSNIDKKKFLVNNVANIYAAKDFIDNNLPHHFPIVHIARKVGINEQKLKQGFREIFGTGLYAYLQEQILKMAKSEIEQTKRPVKQIALRNGYRNANNFSVAFKKKFGVPPLEWRKQFCRNGNVTSE